MRHLILFSVVAGLLMQGPCLAQDAPAVAKQNPNNPAPNSPTANICLVDKTTATDGLVFQSCDALLQNDALIQRGFTTARIDRNTIKSRQPIWVHGMCRYIDNRSNSRDVLVPFGSAEEWQTFNRLVPDIMKVAGCCVPRALMVRDVPEPATPCIGQWQLRQIVSVESLGKGANGEDRIPIDIMQSIAGEGLVNMTGAGVTLPMARDDDNTALTQDGAREFAARWACESEATEDPSAAAQTVPDADPAAIPTTFKNGDTIYVSFSVNCTHENWTPVTLQNFCVPYEGNRALACDTQGYPAGTKGDVLVQEKTICPSGATTRTLIKDNCEGAGAAAQ